MSSKIVRDLEIVRWQGQTKLAELGAASAEAHETLGHSLDDEEQQGKDIIRLLKALDQSAHLTNDEIENLLYCLLEVAGIKSILPAAPSITPRERPTIAIGATGAVGARGPTGPGGDTNVLVSSDPAYDNITVTAVVGGGIIDYQLGYNPYIAPVASIVITNGVIVGGNNYFEVGANNTVNFTASFVEGRETVTQPADTLITTPVGFTWSTQTHALADSVGAIMTRTNRNYTAQVTDGVTPDTDTDVATILFPLFYGSDDAVLTGAEIYTNLNKVINDISTSWQVPFGAGFTDDYGYIAFDSDYDDSNIIIRDKNGYDVTSEFTLFLVDVDSGAFHDGGGGTDWVKQYRVYRTTNKTDIDGTWTVENVTP